MRSVNRKTAVGAILVLLLASCSSNESGPQTRTVRVDYLHDEFPTAIFEYFPRALTVRQGDTVSFQQDWTGDAHTVTMGTLVDKMMALASPLVERLRKGDEVKEEEYAAVDESPEMKALPFFFGQGGVAQNAAQPCYLNSGNPPTEADQTCPKTKKPEFNGRQSFFNSGFIPYEGVGKNEFKVKFAGDTKPGSYFYYCNLHGPAMSGKVTVKPKGASIPSQAVVNRQAIELIDKQMKPIKSVVSTYNSKGKVDKDGRTITGNIAGVYPGEQVVFGGANAFLPKAIEAEVGETVTWTFDGRHSVSFDVPPYFPIYSVKRDGQVSINPKIEEPAGGSPPLPEEPDGPPAEGAPPPKPLEIDGGTWDGNGYFSSGLFHGEGDATYSVRIGKPGKYNYACVIHPAMVGTIVVK
ncbi:MAG: cupredoxin domain-containing protein [Actinomycetota bacterium]